MLMFFLLTRFVDMCSVAILAEKCVSLISQVRVHDTSVGESSLADKQVTDDIRIKNSKVGSD